MQLVPAELWTLCERACAVVVVFAASGRLVPMTAASKRDCTLQLMPYIQSSALPVLAAHKISCRPLNSRMDASFSDFPSCHAWRNSPVAFAPINLRNELSVAHQLKHFHCQGPRHGVLMQCLLDHAFVLFFNDACVLCPLIANFYMWYWHRRL